MVDMIAIRQGSMGSIRYILKDSLKYLPLYGFYFPQVFSRAKKTTLIFFLIFFLMLDFNTNHFILKHGCIYVKRNASTDVVSIQRYSY